MINEGIAEGKYIETVDNTHKDLKRFQDFLYRNLYKHEQYENMDPKSISTRWILCSKNPLSLILPMI